MNEQLQRDLNLRVAELKAREMDLLDQIRPPFDPARTEELMRRTSQITIKIAACRNRIDRNRNDRGNIFGLEEVSFRNN